ncbi:MAG: efflux RND transporter permease subunit, partial [Deltaproteobacteria bacterium]|nr:efflux RND transporter permease subunit [Deltaproteobacteria bacterium]
MADQSNQDNQANQGSFFVRRPIVAMVIALVTVIVGVVFLKALPIEQYPNITPPIVEVRA